MGFTTDTFTQKTRLALAEDMRQAEPAEARRDRLLGDALLDEAVRLQVLANPPPEGLPPKAIADLQLQAARAYVRAILGAPGAYGDLPESVRQRVADAADEKWLVALLSEDAAAEDTDRLGRLVRRLRAAARPWETLRLTARRTSATRLAIVALLALALLAGASRGVRALHGRDIAVGKKWRTSTGQAAASGTVPKSTSADYFFHTKEEPNPWFEVDLGAPTTVGSVVMENRRDCCFARALPVIVELSNDAKTFREVGKTTEEFRSVRVSFAPTSARYVRLRVPHRSFLHLAEVGIFPR